MSQNLKPKARWWSNIKDFFSTLGFLKFALFFLSIITFIIGFLDFVKDFIDDLSASNESALQALFSKLVYPYNFLLAIAGLMVSVFLTLNKDINKFTNETNTNITALKDEKEELITALNNIEFIKILHSASKEILDRLIENSGYLEKIESLQTNEKKKVGSIQTEKEKSKSLPFTHLSKMILEINQATLKGLSKGVINVPIDRVITMHEEIMKQYHTRMDAVSFDDLNFWKKLVKSSQVRDDDHTKLGKDYYELIKEFINKVHYKTTVTRIFVLQRKNVVEEIDSIINIIYEHEKDKIGTALVFTDHFSDDLTEWYTKNTDISTTNTPRKDFALLDINKVATFFRHAQYGDRFEALFDIGGNNNLFNLQKELHQTFVTAALFGTQQFVNNLRNSKLEFYNAKEWKEMIEVVDWLREEMKMKSDDSQPVGETDARKMFTCVFSMNETENSEEKLKENIKSLILSAIEKSDEIRGSWEVERFSKQRKIILKQRKIILNN